MPRPTLSELKMCTEEFFKHHWPKHLGSPPSWSDRWTSKGSVPGGTSAGCYALFDVEDLVGYVGLGASKGGGSYVDFGIQTRVLKYFLWDKSIPAPTNHDRVFKPRVDKMWVNGVRTISFPKEYFYLAPALEAYLIWKLEELRNVNGKRNSAGLSPSISKKIITGVSPASVRLSVRIPVVFGSNDSDERRRIVEEEAMLESSEDYSIEEMFDVYDIIIGKTPMPPDFDFMDPLGKKKRSKS